MIKIFKSNKFISMFLIIMCIIIVFNPAIYAKSCLNAISVWAFKVLPLLFPFFILTRLILNLSQQKPTFTDKLFNKLYNTSCNSSSIFFLSTLCGYPMGAKLISDLYEKNRISSAEGKTMLAFCSVSGPMFIIGTVGVMMLNNYKAGVIILISNIIASLLNGLLYRKNNTKNYTKQIEYRATNSNLLGDCVYDSLISILMVGSYIVLSFLIIDILKNVGFLSLLSTAISKILNIPSKTNVIESVLCGIFEITRGILTLSSTNISIALKSIIASTLIAFGGVSIMLQSLTFLTKLKLPLKSIVLQKTTQTLFCLMISIPLCLIFL